jgi:hypothetical protein
MNIDYQDDFVMVTGSAQSGSGGSAGKSREKENAPVDLRRQTNYSSKSK